MQPSTFEDQRERFLSDQCEWFENWEDLKADMNGVYDGVLRCAVWTIEMDNGSWTLLQKKKTPLTSRNTYHLIQNSRRNKAAPSLVRSMFLLKDVKGNLVVNVCRLQYHVSNEEGRVDSGEVQKHGNSRFTNPKSFYPVKKSTLTAMKDSIKKKEAQGVYSNLRKKAGGVFGASSVSDLPRGKQQIYSAKSRLSSSVAQDDVEDLLKCARDKDDLILHHSDFPEDRWVLGTNSMCSALVKFTSSDVISHPFSVDPTFQIGQFKVTPVVFKTLLLKSKRTDENPAFLGPTMIHH